MSDRKYYYAAVCSSFSVPRYVDANGCWTEELDKACRYDTAHDAWQDAKQVIGAMSYSMHVLRFDATMSDAAKADALELLK